MTFFLIKTGGDVADVNKAAIGIVQGCVMLPDKSKMHFAMERTEISAGHLLGEFGTEVPAVELADSAGFLGCAPVDICVHASSSHVGNC